MIRFETQEDLAVTIKYALGLKKWQAEEWAKRIAREAENPSPERDTATKRRKNGQA